MFSVFKTFLFIYIFWLNNCVQTSYTEVFNSKVNCKIFKCLCLQNALSHMKLSNILMTHKDFDLVNAVVKTASYHDIVNNQINIIYNVDQDEVGALWLLNIYLSIVIPYGKEPDKKAEFMRGSNEHVAIVQMHSFIIEILEREIEKCYHSNILQKDFSNYQLYENFPNESLITLVNCNDRHMREIIATENNYSTPQLKHYEIFLRGSLFLKRLLIKIINFINVYQDDVLWKVDVSKIIKEKYNAANSLDWTIDNLKPIKQYYEAIFGFFKIIFLRLTAKHFLYLQFQDSIYIEDFSLKWLEIMEQYSKLACFENDEVIMEIDLSIKEFIANIPKDMYGSIDEDEILSYTREYYHRLASYIDMILKNLCEPFDCDATQPIFLFGNELPGATDKPPHDPSKADTVEHYSLQNTRIFLMNIYNNSWSLDFDVVRSFIRFVNKFDNVMTTSS